MEFESQSGDTQKFSQTDDKHVPPQIVNKAWGHLIGESPSLPKLGLTYILIQRILPKFDAFFITVHLNEKECRFGRCNESKVVFDEASLGPKWYLSVSKVHFILRKSEDNGVILEDRSTNGTYVNGKIVGGSGKVPGQKGLVALQNNDRISLSSPLGPSKKSTIIFAIHPKKMYIFQASLSSWLYRMRMK
jgi:hypothetical protein